MVRQKKISAVEKRKAEKAQKKYAKQVQAEAEAEKSERKKKRFREIDEWRKESQKRGRDLDERPRKFSRTQKTKDKKWGFGGVKRGSRRRPIGGTSLSRSDLGLQPVARERRSLPRRGRGQRGSKVLVCNLSRRWCVFLPLAARVLLPPPRASLAYFSRSCGVDGRHRCAASCTWRKLAHFFAQSL